MVESLNQRLRPYRKKTYSLLDPDADEGIGFYVNWAIMGLIIINVAAVMLETVDPLRRTYHMEFRVIEVVSVVIFTVEYAARLWSKVEDPVYKEVNGNPLSMRVKIAQEPMLIVDLLAILPFYLTRVGIGLDLRFLRALRLIRLLRLLKLVRYSESMRAFGMAFRKKKDQLVVALTANLILLVVASSMMYFIERDAQPGAFGSIPDTMWWGVVTLTTVGYGNVSPITPIGRILGGIVAVLGIGLFALPASILASGFIEESSYETTYCPDCGHEIDWEQDLGSDRANYEIGDLVRIDLSRTSDSTIEYRYHGAHGEIIDYDAGSDEYEVGLKQDDTVLSRVQREDLRAPHPSRI